jgi:uncharacterized protein
MTVVTKPIDLEQRLSALACLIVPGPRPSYHVFEYQGDRLLYDLLTGTLLLLSPSSFRLLAEIETRAPAREILAKYSDEETAALQAIIDEVGAIHSAGLLRSEHETTPHERAKAIRGLMAHRPRKMMLMVQSNCNLACSYCYEVVNGFHKTGKRMDFETGRRSIEFLIRRSGNRRDIEVTFFGGEPLLNFPLIRQLVDYCRSREAETGKHFTYQITTNCTLLDDEIIAYLVEHKFSVMASIDGPPELHDIHRKDLGGGGSGAIAVENAKRLVIAQRRAGVREAMIRATMSHENHDGRVLSEYFAAQGFTRVMLGASDGRVGERAPYDIQLEDIADLHSEHEQSLVNYLSWLDGTGPRPNNAGQVQRNLGPILRALQEPNTEPQIGCGVARNMQAITRDGKIYPCHRYAGDDAYQLGTLEDGLDPAKVHSYYDALFKVKEEHCSRCWARITCGGQCPWRISKVTGEILHPDVESCNGIRSGHERQLWFAHQLQRRGQLMEPASEEDDEDVRESTETAVLKGVT